MAKPAVTCRGFIAGSARSSSSYGPPPQTGPANCRTAGSGDRKRRSPCIRGNRARSSRWGCVAAGGTSKILVKMCYPAARPRKQLAATPATAIRPKGNACAAMDPRLVQASSVSRWPGGLRRSNFSASRYDSPRRVRFPASDTNLLVSTIFYNLTVSFSMLSKKEPVRFLTNFFGIP